MSFDDRMRPALAFEQNVIARLNQTGWCAYPFGQAQLPDECRRRLTRFEDGCRRPSLIRWMPDIITFRDMPNGRSFVALIDAKGGGTGTLNFAIEMSAIETASIYADQLYTPTFFVFDNWTILTPREARQRGAKGPEPAPGRGSGTPYLLIGKHWARPFDEIFPPARKEQFA
jgi:hypothetical protein